MSFFGGGSRSAPPATPSTQTSFVREAPGIEERKIELMDVARQVAQQPINLPDYQVAGLGALEQQGMNLAGTTGIGAGSVQQGIQNVQGAPGTAGQAQTLANLYGLGASQTAAAGPNINQFLNPYQSYVTGEIGRQGQMMQNQLSANAVNSGAFGGGREGVQQAELQNRTLQAMGQAQAAGFNTALGAGQKQQGLQIQTGLQAGQLGLQGGQLATNAGLQSGQQLGQLGLGQQQMAQGDINQLMASGGVQRQLAQQALDSQRQSTLQQQYEPYQRAEFLSNLYAAGPKSSSQLTMGTQPSTSPLAQSIGTGIGAFAAYSGANQPKAG